MISKLRKNFYGCYPSVQVSYLPPQRSSPVLSQRLAPASLAAWHALV